MAATAKIIKFEELRLSKAAQLTVTLSDLVSGSRIEGLVTAKTDPDAIARIQLALANTEYAMQGRRRESDLEIGRRNSFRMILEPHEVYYSVCLKEAKAEIETVYRWTPADPPPSEEIDPAVSETISAIRPSRQRHVSLALRAAKIAAILIFFLSSLQLGGFLYKEYLIRGIILGLADQLTAAPNTLVRVNREDGVMEGTPSSSLSSATIPYAETDIDEFYTSWHSALYWVSSAVLYTSKDWNLTVLNSSERNDELAFLTGGRHPASLREYITSSEFPYSLEWYGIGPLSSSSDYRVSSLFTYSDANFFSGVLVGVESGAIQIRNTSALPVTFSVSKRDGLKVATLPLPEVRCIPVIDGCHESNDLAQGASVSRPIAWASAEFVRLSGGR
jgi:hypothetical protein